MPNKFWQFRNAADGSGELLLYGNIAGEKSWYSDDVTPKQFAEDLAALGAVSNITVQQRCPRSVSTAAAGMCLRRWKSGTCWNSTRPT